ncbi:hypothetical protein DL96DRAFT_234097 [Flagelloscypha sp. PMI_526]|nr:hypothetical protein DL96DRAFT_234097 [Flagelloscypha sp. PMI_526]
MMQLAVSRQILLWFGDVHAIFWLQNAFTSHSVKNDEAIKDDASPNMGIFACYTSRAKCTKRRRRQLKDCTLPLSIFICPPMGSQSPRPPTTELLRQDF